MLLTNEMGLWFFIKNLFSLIFGLFRKYCWKLYYDISSKQNKIETWFRDKQPSNNTQKFTFAIFQFYIRKKSINYYGGKAKLRWITHKLLIHPEDLRATLNIEDCKLPADVHTFIICRETYFSLQELTSSRWHTAVIWGQF